MRFIKHIFTGWLILFTLIFNIGIVFYFYQLFFHPESFYQGMEVTGTLISLALYIAYWIYCYKTFKNK